MVLHVANDDVSSSICDPATDTELTERRSVIPPPHTRLQ